MRERWDKIWLIAVLAVICLISILVGSIYHHSAAPPNLSITSLPIPPRIDAYVNDPTASVRLTVQIGAKNAPPPPPSPGTAESGIEGGQWMATIYISVIAAHPGEAVKWLVQISGAENNGYQISLVPSPPKPSPDHSQEGIYEGETEPGSSDHSAPGQEVGNFIVQPIQADRGSLVSRLPDISPESEFTSTDNTTPSFGIEQPELTSEVPEPPLSAPPPPPPPPPSQSGVTLPTHLILKSSGILPDQQQVIPLGGALPSSSGGYIVTPYFAPQAVDSVDQLNASLNAYQLVAAFPSTPSASAESTTWEASGDLSPTLTAVRIGVSDARANDSFISGVAFAVAASALIALFQEYRALRREE